MFHTFYILFNLFRIGGTPSDMCWDKNGKHLAITLKNDRALIVFQTALNVSSVDCVLL